MKFELLSYVIRIVNDLIIKKILNQKFTNMKIINSTILTSIEMYGKITNTATIKKVNLKFIYY